MTRGAKTSTRLALVLGVLAVALSVVLHATFDAWVADRFGFWDDDVIGFTPYAWPYLSILAIGLLAMASSGMGAGRSIAGLVALGAVAVLWVLVVDNAVGALRDGEISGAGFVIGCLAVAQVGVLSIWVAFVWRRTRMAA